MNITTDLSRSATMAASADSVQNVQLCLLAKVSNPQTVCEELDQVHYVGAPRQCW